MMFISNKQSSNEQLDGSSKTTLFLVAQKEKNERELIKAARLQGEKVGADEVRLMVRGLSLSFAPSEGVDDIHLKYLSALETRAFSYQCVRPAHEQSVPAAAPLPTLKV